MTLEWKRLPPNAVGAWLRWTGGFGVALHCVLDIGGRLVTVWPEGYADSQVVRLDDKRLRGWLWYGPVNIPERERVGSPQQEVT